MFQDSIQLLLLAILLIGFVFTITKSYREVLSLYVVQTLAIFAIMLVLNWNNIAQDMFLFVPMFVSVSLRVFLMPKLILHFLTKEGFNMVERDFKIPVFGSLLVELGLFLFTYVLMRHVFGQVDLMYFVCLMLVFFGFIVSFNHKKLFSNILGLLLIENAIFLLSVFMLEGIPFFMELGIMMDVCFGFLISLIALIRIKSINAQMSVESMQGLKEVF